MDFSIKAVIVSHMTLQALSQFLQPSFYQQPMSGAMRAAGSPMGAPMMMPPMQMAQPYSQQRLPVMMMPYHSKAADKKYMKPRKRRPKKYYKESDSSSESCSESKENMRSQKQGQGRKKKRQVLTPVISYVTRNGRVVYQKKIKKENAGDWLEMGMKKIPSKLVEEKASGEMTIHDFKNKYRRSNHHHHDYDD